MKKLKKLWWHGHLYKVIDTYKPNDFEAYYIISKDSDYFHNEDIRATDTFMIDRCNDEFFPNTKKVCKLMEKLKILKSKKQEIKGELSSMLDEWDDD